MYKSKNSLEKRDLVTMSNALVRASYRLSVNEMRLLLVVMSKMPKSVDGEDIEVDPNQPYYIAKEDFVKLGVQPETAAREIRSCIHKHKFLNN